MDSGCRESEWRAWGTIRCSAGGIRIPPGRVQGPCRAGESVCSAPERQDVGPGWRCGRRERRGRAGRRPCGHGTASGAPLGIDPPRRREGSLAGRFSAAGGMTAVPGVETERVSDGFGVQQWVSGDHLVACRRLAGPLRAPGAVAARCRPGWRCTRRERRAAWKLTHPRRRVEPSQRVDSRLPQSRPYPRGGSTLSSSPRSSAQIASSLSPSAVSRSASGRLSSHAWYSP